MDKKYYKLHLSGIISDYKFEHRNSRKPLISLRNHRICGYASKKRVMGIEPTYLAWKASVLPLNYTRIHHNIFNAQNRNRTSDTRIFSPLLYQLSYLGFLHKSLHHNIDNSTRKQSICQEVNVNFFYKFYFISFILFFRHVLLAYLSLCCIFKIAYNTAAAT